MHIPFLSIAGSVFYSIINDVSNSVTITNSGGGARCEISNLNDLRDYAKKLLSKAVNKGYAHFPINRTALVSGIINKFLNKDAVCSTLINSSFINESNYNKLRQKFKGKSAPPDKARKLGVIAKRLKLEQRCPDDYNWPSSPYYVKADSCGDVLDVIDGRDLPVVMYSARMKNTTAAAKLSDISISTFYMKYANGGPVVCEKNEDHIDTYHKISVINGLNIEYVMRAYNHEDWSAWTLLKSCKSQDGKVYNPTDLMFNFGARVFIPINVVEEGVFSERVIIISTIAAASTNPFAELVPDSIAFHRFIGGELIKKIILTAMSNAWPIE